MTGYARHFRETSGRSREGASRCTIAWPTTRDKNPARTAFECGSTGPTTTTSNAPAAGDLTLESIIRSALTTEGAGDHLCPHRLAARSER
jgi:hypothetical protein